MKIFKCRINFISFVVLFILLAFTDVFAQATSKEFAVTDYGSDITYRISSAGNGISISSEDFYTLLPVSTPVLSCCINNGVVHILSYSEDGDSFYASYYSLDTYTCNFNYTIMPELRIDVDETRFTVDSKNNFYLVDSTDNRTVNRYHSGSITAFELNATVNQIVCLDGENILVLTSKGIFALEETKAVLVSAVIPQSPCTYIGSGIIEDSAGIGYTYENCCLYPQKAETTEAPNTIPVADSNTDVCIKDEYILVSQGFTVAKLYKNLGIAKSDLTVYKTDGTVLSQGTLGTGMKINFYGKTYSIVIFGELTGEGNINSKDLKIMMKHLTGEEELSSLQKISADINQDGIINTKDLVLLSRMY